MTDIRNVIDLHCDTLTECLEKRRGLDDENFNFSLGKRPSGYHLCQCMAVWMPDGLRGEKAAEYFLKSADLFKDQMMRFSDRISQVSDLRSIGSALLKKPFAAVLTIEGGSALAGDILNVGRYYGLGARIMTLTWNNKNEICGGVLSDSGFTVFGRQVIREMERVGMVADTAHLNDKSFFELCEFAEKPFINTHSNSRKICPHKRNITDEMFGEIVRRGGILGLNYGKGFIRGDGKNGTVNDMLKHIHHFLALGGEDTLALGSDYDGTDLPDYLEGIDKIGSFSESMEKSGIPRRTVDKILFENANRCFENFAQKI